MSPSPSAYTLDPDTGMFVPAPHPAAPEAIHSPQELMGVTVLDDEDEDGPPFYEAEQCDLYPDE